MTLTIPEEVLQIYNTLHNKGYSVFLVGGSVRNLLLNKPIKDYDLTTNATPEDIQSLFPDGFYDNSFGTVGIPYEDKDGTKHVAEVTTFRTESEYTDRRRPGKVEWGKSIEEDLERRDFTVNAIALEIVSSKTSLVTRIIDPFNGQKDLEKKILRAVGDPDERFKEDALRLLRGIRFATQLEFSIHEETKKKIMEDAPLIKEIAWERIKDELMKILGSDHPYEGIMLLKEVGLLEYILPELIEGIGVSQARPGRHHTEDVFTHNVLSLKFCTSDKAIVRFATLIHDIGKPRVVSKDENGYVIFHNHEIMGARIAAEICDRLRFSRKEKEKVVTLVRWHMFTVDEKITDAAIRRFIRRVGVENVKDMMDLRIGDRLGGGTQTAESWRLKLFKKRMEEQLAPAPFGINDLAIDGNDVMKELNIEPGKEIGELLQKLFEEVDEDLSKNTKEYLLTRIKDLSQPQ